MKILSSSRSISSLLSSRTTAIRLASLLLAGVLGSSGAFSQEREQASSALDLLRLFDSTKGKQESSVSKKIPAKKEANEGQFDSSTGGHATGSATVQNDTLKNNESPHKWILSPPRIRMFSKLRTPLDQPRIRVDLVIVEGLDSPNEIITPEKLDSWRRDGRVKYYESGVYPPGDFKFSPNLTQWLRKQPDPDPWRSGMVFVITLEPAFNKGGGPNLEFHRSHPVGVGSAYSKNHGRVENRTYDYSNLGWCKPEYEATWTISLDANQGHLEEWVFQFKQ